MKKMQTLTVNGNTYQVSDPGAVSFAEPQQLTEEQKQQAKENLGIAGQYQLIEDITLEEGVKSFVRTETPDAAPYNFSAVRVYLKVPSQSGTTTNDTLLFYFRNLAQNKNVVYHAQKNALSNNWTVFLVRNDGGYTEHYATSSWSDSAAATYMTPSNSEFPWYNVDRVALSARASNEAVCLPAGTQIKIYGIWG